MDIRIVNPLDFPDWDNMVAPLPGISFFHSSAWARVLSETYTYKPVYFAIFDKDQLTGFLASMDIDSFVTGKKGISLPFTDNCDPIICDRGQFNDLLQKALDYGKSRNWKSLELRGGQSLLPDAASSQTFLTHVIDLRPGEKEISARFRDSTRRNIRKAVKEGVTIEISTSFSSIKEFYRLNCMTRKEHGLPPQPFRFFESVHRNIISQGHGFVSQAIFRNKVIAANMYFHFREKAIYKYGASDRKYQHTRSANLVMWEGIRFLHQTGCSELHLGRTELPHQGLRQFKLGWGAREETCNYLKYDMRNNAYVSDAQKQTDPFYSKIFKNTPISLLKMAGLIAYRHIA